MLASITFFIQLEVFLVFGSMSDFCLQLGRTEYYEIVDLTLVLFWLASKGEHVPPPHCHLRVEVSPGSVFGFQ